MKVAIWANTPSPQQADFYAALRRHGIDLRVLYLEHLGEARRSLGWTEPEQFPAGETILRSRTNPLVELADWRDRVHVVPGYSRREHRRLAVELSRAGAPWVHWSESSRPVWRAYVTWTVKRWYGAMVNRAALGAFGHGVLATNDFCRWGIRPEKMANLYYSVDGVAAATPLDEVTMKFVAGRTAFVFVGSLCRRKACDVLLKAFARMCGGDGRDEMEPILVMLGDGPQASDCRRLAAELHVSHRVLFRGSLPPAEVGSVLKCCQVLVLPSRFDGWGVVLNEGASAGLALIATDRCGAAFHILEPGLNGYRVRAGSTSSLAAAMAAYARDPNIARVHGAHSLSRFEQFTPDANAVRLISSVRGWLAGAETWNRWRVQWNGVAISAGVERAA
jgi:glycosyltransferase involved in cell wall biosynthesis